MKNSVLQETGLSRSAWLQAAWTQLVEAKPVDGNPAQDSPGNETINHGKPASEEARSPSPGEVKPRLNNQSSVEDAIAGLTSSLAGGQTTPSRPEAPEDMPGPGNRS